MLSYILGIHDSPLDLPDLTEDLPPTIPGSIDINEAHVALGSSVRGLEVVAEQLANFDYGWRQVWHGVLCVPPSSSVMKLDHSDVRLLQWDPNMQSVEVLEELMPLDDSGTVTAWLLSKMSVLVPDYTTVCIQAQPLVRSPSLSHNEARAHSLCLWNKGVPEYCKEVPGYLPTTILLALDSLLVQQEIAPHSIPPNDLLLLTLEGTVVDENTLEEINKELKKRSRGDSSWRTTRRREQHRHQCHRSLSRELGRNLLGGVRGKRKWGGTKRKPPEIFLAAVLHRSTG